MQAQGWSQGMRAWRPPIDGVMNLEKYARPLPGMRQFVLVELEGDSEG